MPIGVAWVDDLLYTKDNITHKRQSKNSCGFEKLMDKGICGNRIHISDLHPSYVGCFSFTGIWVGSLSESSHMHAVCLPADSLDPLPPPICYINYLRYMCLCNAPI